MKAKIQKLSKNSQRIQNSTCIVSNGASTGNLFQNRTSKLIEQKIRVAIELFSIRVFVSETRAGYTHHDVGTTSARCTPGVRSAFRGHCKTKGGEHSNIRTKVLVSLASNRLRGFLFLRHLLHALFRMLLLALSPPPSPVGTPRYLVLPALDASYSF